MGTHRVDAIKNLTYMNTMPQVVTEVLHVPSFKAPSMPRTNRRRPTSVHTRTTPFSRCCWRLSRKQSTQAAFSGSIVLVHPMTDPTLTMR